MTSNYLIIITGASRGFGRAVALSYAKLYNNVGDHVHYVLTSRKVQDLQISKEDILEARKGCPVTTSFSLIEGDMGDVDKLEELAKHLFSEVDSVDRVTTQYKSIIFISNAGVLGPLSYVGTHALVDINSAISLNITGGTFLTSEFIRRIESSASKSSKAVVVNVTSLSAIQGSPTKGVYCLCKAARDMYHKVLADEQTKKKSLGLTNKDIKVLSYAPGPLDTDMQAELRAAPGLDEDLSALFIKLKGEGALLDASTSSDRMVELLCREELFESGAHVDYYDEFPTFPLPGKATAAV